MNLTSFIKLTDPDSSKLEASDNKFQDNRILIEESHEIVKEGILTPDNSSQLVQNHPTHPDNKLSKNKADLSNGKARRITSNDS